jgi:hypothetical protein
MCRRRLLKWLRQSKFIEVIPRRGLRKLEAMAKVRLIFRDNERLKVVVERLRSIGSWRWG